MLVHFEQILSDLKGFRTFLVKKLFRLKMCTFIGNENHFKAVLSSFFRFLKFLTAFRFCAFWPFWLCQRFLNDYF